MIAGIALGDSQVLGAGGHASPIMITGIALGDT
jgi:hypothetical protein